MRAHCGAYQIKGASLLREVERLMHKEAAEVEEGLIDVNRLLLANPDLLEALDQHLTSRCAGQRDPRPTIGGVPLHKLAHDPSLRASVSESLLEPSEEWVQIGRMFIWQRAEPRLSYSAFTVVGYESMSRWGWNVAFADGHVSFENPESENAAPAFIERDAPNRAEYGQPPLPAEWFVLPPRK